MTLVRGYPCRLAESEDVLNMKGARALESGVVVRQRRAASVTLRGRVPAVEDAGKGEEAFLVESR